MCNRCPAWIGVKPGSPDDDPYDCTKFVISVMIPELNAISYAILDQDLPEEEIMAESDSLFKESYAWLRSGIYASWNQVNIQKLHAKKVSGKFAVYTSEVGDVETDNFALMDWLCGDKLTHI
jgi:hypothetical protein